MKPENLNIISKEQLYDFLLKNKKDKTPFSLIRFGDGEGLFSFPEWNVRSRFIGACLKHWGEIPLPEERDRIARNIRRSYLECDFAGIPTAFRFLENSEKLWAKTVHSLIHLYEHPQVVDMNIHIFMLEDNFYNKLIKHEDVFYLSCRNVDSVLFEKGAKSIEKILISPQYRFEEIKPKEKFYQQVPAIEKKLREIDLTGKLCLFGAGVAGKQLGLIMKEQGGRVVDIGSVFDYWLGFGNRSWIRKKL